MDITKAQEKVLLPICRFLFNHVILPCHRAKLPLLRALVRSGWITLRKRRLERKRETQTPQQEQPKLRSSMPREKLRSSLSPAEPHTQNNATSKGQQHKRPKSCRSPGDTAEDLWSGAASAFLSYLDSPPPPGHRSSTISLADAVTMELEERFAQQATTKSSTLVASATRTQP